MNDPNTVPHFGLLVHEQRSKLSLAFSIFVNILAVLSLYFVTRTAQHIIEYRRKIENVTFVQPIKSPPTPKHIISPRDVPSTAQQVLVLETTAPRIVASPRIAAPPPPPPMIPTSKPEFLPTPSANVTVRPEVKVGAFGNPTGAQVNETSSDKRPQAPVVGSFGGAQGHDSGSGSARHSAVTQTGFGTGVMGGVPGGSSRGTVTSAGFSLTATPGHGVSGRNNGTVAGTSFGQSVASNRPVQTSAEPVTVPATVTSVPRPAYTAEARARRIEGEVILRVRLTSTGQSQVLGIERSLDPDLDREASAAAQKVQFMPATRNGQPVDQITLIHIHFQLA